MIEMRRAQRSFGDGLIAEEVGDLREDWMRHADQVLADEQMVAAVYEALGKRHPKSRSRGRLGTPAEAVLRLLILKHIRNWSYGVFSSARYAPIWCTATSPAWAARRRPTPRRWGAGAWRWGENVIKQIHTRMVTMAQSDGLTEGRRMRVDTTVVETNIHHPTNSSLLGGVRVLIRTMKKIRQIVGEAGPGARGPQREAEGGQGKQEETKPTVMLNGRVDKRF